MGFTKKTGLSTVVIILIGLIAGCSRPHLVTAVQGVFLLPPEFYSDRKTVPLNGEWEFYWNRLYLPGDIPGPEEQKHYFNVPGLWNDYVYDGVPCPGYGFATFRLVIKNHTRGWYALKIREIDTAYSVSINGELLETTGRVGKSRSESLPSWQRKEILFQADGDIEIIMQISNFHHRKGGPEELILFGTAHTVLNEKSLRTGLEIFLLGSLFILALYHFGLFFLNRKDVSSLLFAVLCLLISIRLSCTGEKLLISIFPEFNWELAVKIEYLSITSTLVCFMLFIRTLFPGRVHAVFAWIIYGITTALAVFILVTPVTLFSYSIFVIEVAAIAGFFYILGILVYAMIKKTEGALLFFSGTLIFGISAVNDTLYNNLIIATDYVLPYGLFLLVFAQSMILLLKFTNAMKNEVKLRNNLVEINASLKRFVPTEFIRYLKKESITEIELGDQIKSRMSILFADIRSFTSLSEVITPEENFNFLNSFYNYVTPVIAEYHGFIDKFIGDAFIALFPGTCDDAVQAAIQLQARLADYNRENMQSNRFQLAEPLRIGIGIHFGNMMLGTIGNRDRMETTVISDTVNLASRLQDLTKTYGSQIIISSEVFMNLENPGKYRIRFLGNAHAKGKKEPVPVYEVFDPESAEIQELKTKTHTDFEKALNHYHYNRYHEAMRLFAGVIEKNPHDRAAHYFLKSCRKMLIKARRRK